MALDIANKDEEANPVTDNITDVLKGYASDLVAKLESGDMSGASELITEINNKRDESLYQEVGRLTRALHSAIMEFHLDIGLNKDSNVEQEISEMSDASSRLSYVINLTEEAANKTMDMVDECVPVAEKMAVEAKELKADWGRLMRREIAADEFRVLYRRIETFLDTTEAGSSGLSSKFTEILMAQGYQDLSGQVIKRVIQLVSEVEASLVTLVRLAGAVEAIAGLEKKESEVSEDTVEADVVAEGPQVDKGKGGVVAGQDEVDDLLSSLGF